ncbi:hypothetical protein BJV74DRAFT_195870 [Russula compacta]|nr:hypothetical protein BJV74DRAFT_195870 [Russula compacta]
MGCETIKAAIKALRYRYLSITHNPEWESRNRVVVVGGWGHQQLLEGVKCYTDESSLTARFVGGCLRDGRPCAWVKYIKS